MAQRMESAAPAGGVMLSSSTARLVEDLAVLSDAELVNIKGADNPVPARRLLGAVARGERMGRSQSTLVGRDWQAECPDGHVDQAIKGHGCVAGVVGPAGIGKSRILSELAAIATSRGVEVFSAYCESHTSDVPFYSSNGLLRAAVGMEGLDASEACEYVKEQNRGADPVDLLLLYDVLGIGDPTTELPDLAPEARRRRLAALVNAAVLARTTPAIYVIEDAHWIDETSESVMADFLPVIPHTRSLMLFTYRPEYHGTLSQARGGQTIALAPLDDLQTAALVAEQLELIRRLPDSPTGSSNAPQATPFSSRRSCVTWSTAGSSSVAAAPTWCRKMSPTSACRPRCRSRSQHVSTGSHSAAKHTLNAAAVIGSRFSIEVLTALSIEPVLDELIAAELIDQVGSHLVASTPSGTR